MGYRKIELNLRHAEFELRTNTQAEMNIHGGLGISGGQRKLTWIFRLELSEDTGSSSSCGKIQSISGACWRRRRRKQDITPKKLNIKGELRKIFAKERLMVSPGEEEGKTRRGSTNVLKADKMFQG